MASTHQQEKQHVISDVSSDDDVRELAKLGKKPVLRVWMISTLCELQLMVTAKFLSPCHPWPLVLFDDHVGGSV